MKRIRNGRRREEKRLLSIQEGTKLFIALHLLSLWPIKFTRNHLTFGHCLTVNIFVCFFIFENQIDPIRSYSVWKSLTCPHAHIRDTHTCECACMSSYTFLKIVNIKLDSFMSNKNVWHQKKRYFQQAQPWKRRKNTQNEIRWPEHVNMHGRA